MTERIFDDIVACLHLDKPGDVVVKACSPDRPNIFVEVHNKGTSFETELAWLLDIVIQKHLDCPKTVIFVRAINTASDIFGWMMIIIIIKSECHSNIIVDRLQGCSHSKKLRESESESRSSKVV